MGRFLVFGYDDYYPQGGMNDLMASFDSMNEAKAFAAANQSIYKYHAGRVDNITIFDMVGKTVTDVTEVAITKYDAENSNNN